ncbi:MAG: glycosyltransferase family 4 protein [Phycisphaerae bacterium]|nr:glycosyltransferase family 4 protein [Phycisphaerae bacterium]
MSHPNATVAVPVGGMSQSSSPLVDGRNAVLRIAQLGAFPPDPEKIGGGVSAVIKHLACGLARREDAEVHVLSCHPELSAPERREYAGVHLHALPGQKRFGVITGGFWEQRTLRRYLAELRPDIVHGHGSGPYALAALESGYPAIVTPHGMKSREHNLNASLTGRVRRYCELRGERRMLSRARHLFSIADYVTECVGPFTRAKMFPTRNPVDDGLFSLDGTERALTVLCVAVISPRKGQLDLVRAFAKVAADFPAAELRLIGKVGDADYKAQVQSAIDGAGIASRAGFVGHVSTSDLRRYFSECAAFALCSFEETSPVSIAEAMTLGKPAIATRVGGVPSLVDDGRTGILVNYGDVEAIAAALRALLSDAARRRQFGAAAREIAERRFRPAAAAAEAMAAYREVIADWRRQ